LFVLLALSLLGVAATTSSRIETQLAVNDRMHKEAFAAAEYALVLGEMTIEGFSQKVDLQACSSDPDFAGRYSRDDGPCPQPTWSALTWENVDSHQIVPTHIAPDLLPAGLAYVQTDVTALSPRYTLNIASAKRDSLTVGIGVPSEITYYGIAARGIGSRTGAFSHGAPAEVIITTTYAKRH
jgi:Tfp pilus assembly protein PilX